MPLPLIEPHARRQRMHHANSLTTGHEASPPLAGAALEFGRFRVLLRQRRLLRDGAPVQLGTRAFDLLLALLEADGSLVTKDQLVARVWPGIAVVQENLKVQISMLRRVLGADRDSIRTEFGRGYRFTALVRSTADWSVCAHPARQSHLSGRRPSSQRTSRRSLRAWCAARSNWPAS